MASGGEGGRDANKNNHGKLANIPYYEPDGSKDDIVPHFAKVSVDM